MSGQNPRKFTERISNLLQREQEGNEAFQQIMREVRPIVHPPPSARTPSPSASASASPSDQHHLIAAPSLPYARGGSLPNVNAIGSVPDALPQRISHPDRRASAGPLRTRTRADPYGSVGSPSPYLCPPHEAGSWRRSHSDSAIQNSLAGATTCSRQLPGGVSPPHHHRGVSPPELGFQRRSWRSPSGPPSITNAGGVWKSASSICCRSGEADNSVVPISMTDSGSLPDLPHNLSPPNPPCSSAPPTVANRTPPPPSALHISAFDSCTTASFLITDTGQTEPITVISGSSGGMPYVVDESLSTSPLSDPRLFQFCLANGAGGSPGGGPSSPQDSSVLSQRFQDINIMESSSQQSPCSGTDTRAISPGPNFYEPYPSPSSMPQTPTIVLTDADAISNQLGEPGDLTAEFNSMIGGSGYDGLLSEEELLNSITPLDAESLDILHRSDEDSNFANEATEIGFQMDGNNSA